jgi:hypothetical protein
MRKGRILSLRPFHNDRAAAQFNVFAAEAPRSRAALLIASYRVTPGSGYTLTQRADEPASPSAPRGAPLLGALPTAALSLLSRETCYANAKRCL